MDTGRLQTMGPGDVVPFVEARLELDKNSHLLASLSCLDQQIDQGRVRPDAVERHFDRAHVWILNRGLAEMPRTDVKRIEWMMHEMVALADLVEDRLDVVVDPHAVRRERWILELRMVQAA